MRKTTRFLNVFWLLLAASSFASAVAWGEEFDNVKNPRTFQLNYASLTTKSMAFACLGVLEIPDDIPCNPALLRVEKKPRFVANGVLSNGYQGLSKARRLMDNNLDSDLMNSLFTQDRILEVETNPSMMFTSSYLAGKYLLYGLQLYSTQRNQANPEIQLFTAESKQWILQTAFSLHEHFHAGLQFRSQKDKIIRKNFRLVDTGTDNGKSLLEPHEYSRMMIEPGLAATFEHIQISLFQSGLQVSGDHPPEIDEKSELQGGVSSTFTLPYGVLDLSVDYKSLSYKENPDQKIHWGGRYRYGALNLLGGLDYHGASGGVLFTVEKIYSGIMYSTSRVPWREEGEYAQTVYIELGWQL